MNADRVLVDTSVWIEYFRGGDPDVLAKMDGLIKSGRVWIPPVVLAEMIQGARSRAEFKIIEDLRDAFTMIDQREGPWLAAGKLSYDMRKRGKSFHLTDCYIATIARENGCAVFTRDVHFPEIREVLDIKLL